MSEELEKPGQIWFNLCNLETLMGGVQHSKATGSCASLFQFFSLKLLICVSLENILYCFLMVFTLQQINEWMYGRSAFSGS